MTDNEIFSLVEESVTSIFDELRTAGVPVVEFSWSRKTKDSQITKLLLKKETNAARVFDRLRFRLIVRDAADLVPTLRILLHRCIPFNYIVPGQTVEHADRPVLPQGPAGELRHRGRRGPRRRQQRVLRSELPAPQLHRRPAGPRRATAGDLAQLADADLYRAKAGGRDRVEFTRETRAQSA